ncbi:deoxyhypusine hydroxylase [Sclerotinia borealis F-4128]|uniref:Deoxyhypusine hydroxylase n=1 Tax=Sclerotinia borealis (strain F-4128) TaxID=1432307 RepID=W9CL25_SCLBF|nr:deoxyhypusine hydroxylase [Sclerotinia borealis F-4128]
MAPSATSPAPEETTDATVLTLRKTLCSESSPLALRFRALFSLKHLACTPSSSIIPAIEAIAAAFASPSALLKHELAYCLGQTRNIESSKYLRLVLEDREEDSMVRHEAAEALGALGDRDCLQLLRERRDDVTEPPEVSQTCELSVERIEWEHSEAGKAEKLRQSDFASIDPAPPTAEANSESLSIEKLEKTLLDTKTPLFIRYRAMFGLRDLASPPDLLTAVPAILALAKGLHDPSVLFRHEIAFVFGQLSHPASIPALTGSLSNLEEASMVRHEAAEALGSLGDEDGVEDTLKKFLDDHDEVVRDSVIVALDMAEFEKNGETEYAFIPEEEYVDTI